MNKANREDATRNIEETSRNREESARNREDSTRNREDLTRQVNIAEIKKDIGFIKGEVTEIKEHLESLYVTKDEFDPVKKVVYGLVGTLLTGIVVALLALILERKI